MSHTKKLTKSAGFLSWRGKEPRIGRGPFLRNKKGCGDDGDSQGLPCKKNAGASLQIGGKWMVKGEGRQGSALQDVRLKCFSEKKV